MRQRPLKFWSSDPGKAVSKGSKTEYPKWGLWATSIINTSSFVGLANLLQKEGPVAVVLLIIIPAGPK